MSEQMVCPWHKTPFVPDPCQACEEEFAGPIPETVEERASEIERLMGDILTVPFGVMRERMERLVGRSVWTHEFAFPEYLAHEVRTGLRPSMAGILAKFPPDMRVVVVEGES